MRIVINQIEKEFLSAIVVISQPFYLDKACQGSILLNLMLRANRKLSLIHSIKVIFFNKN